MSREIAHRRYLNMLQTAFGVEIMKLLEDDEVIEIMLNPDGQLIVEKLYKGKEPTGVYIPEERSDNIVKLVASFKNRIADDEAPEVSTEIPFKGARFQGWLPPIVAKPTFAIRKKAVHIFKLEDYLEKKSITQKAYEVLKEAVKNRKNIVVVGGTGSGKTTFANALVSELNGSHDRILVLEDLPELQIKAEDVVFMCTSSHVTMRDLVKGSLRMRPDRIIIGEVRDGAALELLKAWNTGHPGGICTIHANSAESAPYRFEDLLQEVVITVPRNLILQAIDMIAFIERDKEGHRNLKELVSLDGYDEANKAYQFKSLL